MSGRVTIALAPDLPSYTADQEVLVTMSFEDTAGVPTNAGEVTLTVVRPDGVQIEYTLSGGDIAHPATGVYTRAATMTMPSDWLFHVQGSTIVAAAQTSASVEDSYIDVTSPPLPPPGVGSEGKIARVTGGAYVPYGGGADEQPLVWRTGTGWVGQALNLAAAAAVAGLLAVSHIAAGANTQVLTTVGGVTTWAAPAAPAAGGGAGEVQYNNAGALDGASGIKVVGSETAIAYGSTPAGTGLGRYEQGALVAVGRNAVNSLDATLLDWGVVGTDRLRLGSSTVTAGVTLDWKTGGDLTYRINGSPAFTFDANGLAMGAKPVTDVTFVTFSGTAATAGNIRFPNGGGGNDQILGRNNANTANVGMLSLRSDDAIRLGDGTNATVVYLQSSTSTSVRIAGTDEYVFSATTANFTNNFLLFGTNPSGSGLINFPHGSAHGISGRDQANSADIDLLRWGNVGTNILTFGSSTSVAKIESRLATGATYDVLVNGTVEYTYSSTIADFKDNALRFGTNPATSALINMPYGSGMLASRNSANSGDRNVVRFATYDGSADCVVIGENNAANIFTASTSHLWYTTSGSGEPGTLRMTLGTSNLTMSSALGLIWTGGTTALNGSGINVDALTGKFFDNEIDDGNSGAADTIDWSTGPCHKSTLTGNVTYTFTAPSQHKFLQLRMIQDGTGGRSATWPATVKWAGGAAPTWTTTAGAVNIATFYWNGTSYFGVGSTGFA